jgi:hypothetical protein
MRYVVMTIWDNIPDEIQLATDSYERATKCFLDECRSRLSNFDEYDAQDIDNILDDGYVQTVDGRTICILDVSNAADKIASKDIRSVRESIQEDQIAYLDGMDQEVITELCQIVVDNFKKIS